jgi:hypothetical protein
VVFFEHFRIDLKLTRNISFSRSSAVSTIFGVNWDSVATKLIDAGTTYCGSGYFVELDAGSEHARRGGHERKLGHRPDKSQWAEGQRCCPLERGEIGPDLFCKACEFCLRLIRPMRRASALDIDANDRKEKCREPPAR